MIVFTIRVVKMKEHLPFCGEFSILVLKIEFLSIVLPNFEREAALKD